MSTAKPEGERAGAEAGASVLSGLIATAQTRRHQLKTRFIIAAIGASIMWFAATPMMSLLWFSALTISQIVDVYVWRPFTDSSRRAPATRMEWIMLCTSAMQASTIYSAFPALMWITWGAAGKIFAILWLSGALLHVTMHMHHEKRTFTAAVIPHGIYYFGLPLAAFIADGEPGRFGAGAILAAGLMYVGHLASAFREYQASSAAMRLSREQAQERQALAEQANQAKSAFLANMSHEIRTPMNGILGMAAALENTQLTLEQQRKLKIISDSGDLLMMVLNDLLDFSKIEANKVEIEKAPFQLSEIIRKVDSLHGFKAMEKGVVLKIDCAIDHHKSRLGDGHRILQVMHNLVSNAIKFTDKGSVSVTILEGAENEYLRIEVADTGIGMTEEQCERIFDPFTQADASTTREYGGTGLGLSIVKGLLDSMGGTIAVKSVRGEGSVFIIEFPAPLAAAADTRAGEIAAPVGVPALSGLRVLVGEDNNVNQAVLKAFLAERGHDVYFAADGLDVISAFKRGRYDVILMDISMPVLDGVEALRQIRFFERAENAPQPTPVIAVSAHAMRQQVEEYLAAGFNGYVTKPIRPELLHGEIDRVLADLGYSGRAANVA